MRKQFLETTYGDREVIKQVPPNKVLVRCKCGRERVITVRTLKYRPAKNCRYCGAKKRPDYHGDASQPGKARTSEYTIWCGMRARCGKPQEPGYKNYGGRGISVCERWKGPRGYKAFLADMGRRTSPEHSIDRIDNDGNYSPDNCRWATREEQARNKRRPTKWAKPLTYGDKTQPVSTWEKELGLQPGALHWRLRNGWSVQRATTTPIGATKAPVTPKEKTAWSVDCPNCGRKAKEFCVTTNGKLLGRGYSFHKARVRAWEGSISGGGAVM